MKQIPLGATGVQVSAVAVGCMRLANLDEKAAEHHIRTAIEAGANFFDHADIYGNGVCEERFASAISMNPQVRQTMVLQSKCGIRRGKGYDFSKEHILSSVDGILKRLNTEYLDVLVLHRPDTLMEPEEVAEAFDQLQGAGKVRHFGVSNHNSMQIQLLQKYVRQPISVNQLQFSPAHATIVSQGLHVNTLEEGGLDRDGSVLEFCRLKDITIQTWSPFQHGMFRGTYLDNDQFPELNAKLQELGEQYGVSKTTMALAWILRHPAKMQAVVGTTNTQRLLECIRAADVTMTREEWYALYRSAGNTLP